MDEIDPAEWDRLTKDLPTPLLDHAWLSHLERSGSITPRSGWDPHHLVLYEKGRLVAAAPLYLRDNSWGEFVFDFAFSQVADEINAPYYPKLVGMSPATPSSAYALLTEEGREAELSARLLEETERWCRREGVPVLQFNYVLPDYRTPFETAGMLAWEHHGYAWYNEGFSRFEDYLARFRKNQRRNVKRERRSLEEQGLTVRVVPAVGAPEHYFARMAEYYLRTNAQFGPYAARFLESRFFTTMPEKVRRLVYFVVALPVDAAGTGAEIAANSDPVAMAMLVRKASQILGRYWGTREPLKDLHFNVCYYEPIDWAIREGIEVFDPGMGSEHKVRRGFRSIANYSMHRFFDPSMQAILEANIDRINAWERQAIRTLDEAVPYKA